MGTQNNKNEIEIDLRGLISTILNRLTIIILVGILVGGIAFAYTEFFITPQYLSTTKVYILSRQDPNQSGLTSSDLAFASDLANDYQVLLTSEPVLSKVKEDLKLDYTVGQLASMVEVELEEDTRILDIKVSSPDAKLSKKIADKVRDVANEKTKEVMEGVEAVNPVDEATLPRVPASPHVEKNTMLGFIGGFGLALLIVILMFVLDDTIKTPDDIEKKLGVSVLASIPLKSAKSKGYGYGYGYGYGSTKKKDDSSDEESTEGKE